MGFGALAACWRTPSVIHSWGEAGIPCRSDIKAIASKIASRRNPQSTRAAGPVRVGSDGNPVVRCGIHGTVKSEEEY